MAKFGNSAVCAASGAVLGPHPSGTAIPISSVEDWSGRLERSIVGLGEVIDTMYVRFGAYLAPRAEGHQVIGKDCPPDAPLCVRAEVLRAMTRRVETMRSEMEGFLAVVEA